MTRRHITALSSVLLAAGQVAPALAQATREAVPATRPAPAERPAPVARPAPMRPPATRPAPPPAARPVARPGVRPERPITRPTPGYERPVGPGLGRPPEGWDGSGDGWHWTQPGYPPPNWGGWGNDGWGNNWQGWGGGYRRLTCESRDGRYRRCNANTQGRVGIIRTLSDARCRQGYSWGYNRSHIWVSNGCRAEFAYGYGGGGSGWNDNRGSSTGDVIAGVAVASGLIALLAAANKGGSSATRSAEPEPGAGAAGRLPYQPHSGPARIVADYSALPSLAQAPARTCMDSVAQQIGATGGASVTWVRTLGLEPGNGGYRFNVVLRADYPDGARDLALYCRATPDRVVQLDFAALSG